MSMSLTSLEPLCIPRLPPSLCSKGDRRLDDMLSNRMKPDERQKHCRVPPKKTATFSSRPLSSALERTGSAHDASRLTSASKWAAGRGRLWNELLWQISQPPLTKNPSLSLQQRGGLLTRKPLDPLCSCLSFPLVLCAKQCERVYPTFGGRWHIIMLIIFITNDLWLLFVVLWQECWAATSWHQATL